MATSLAIFIDNVRMRTKCVCQHFVCRWWAQAVGVPQDVGRILLFLLFKLVILLKFMTLNEGYTVQYHIQSIHDVYETNINRNCTGSDIVLLCYWTTTRELPLSAVHTRSELLRIIFYVQWNDLPAVILLMCPSLSFLNTLQKSCIWTFI